MGYAAARHGSFNLTVIDHDAPKPGGWVHWAVFHIPASARALSDAVPRGAMVRLNDFGTKGWGGPCPRRAPRTITRSRSTPSARTIARSHPRSSFPSTNDDALTGRWRVLTLMTTAQAGASVVQQALGSLSPTFVSAFGLSKAQLGVIFTALMLGSALFVGAAGVLTDRWGERRIVLLSGMTMTAALLAATLFASYAWLVACIAVFGASYAASTPAGGRAILAWFDRDRGFAMGIRQTGVPVGGLFGALTLPVVAHVAGYRGAFVFAAVIVAVTTLIAYAGYREQRDDDAPATTLASVLRGMHTLARDPRLIGVTLTCMVLVSAQIAMNAFLTVTGVVVVGTSAAVAALAFAARKVPRPAAGSRGATSATACCTASV